MKDIFQGYNRDQIADFIVEKSIDAHSVYIVGIDGCGKSELARKLFDKFRTSDRNPIMLKCRNSWDVSDFFTALSEMLYHSSGDGRAVKCADHPELYLDFLSKGDLPLLIDDFQLAEFPETLELLEKAAGLQSGCVIALTNTRPGVKISVEADIFSCLLPGLTEGETSELIKELFEFQCIAPPMTQDQRTIFKMTKGHALSVKVVCALLITGRTTLTELVDADLLSEYRDSNFDQPVWDTYTEEFKHILKLFSLVRTPLERCIISDVVGVELAGILDNLRLFCLADVDYLGRISISLMVKNYVLGKLDQSEVYGLHKELAELLARKFCYEPARIKEIYFHFISAGKRRFAVDALVKCGHASLFLEEMGGDIVSVVKEEIRKGGYRVHDLHIVLTGQLIIEGRLNEALEEASRITGFFKRYFEAVVTLQKGNGEIALAEFSALLMEKLDPGLECLVLSKRTMCKLFLGDLRACEHALSRMRKLSENKDNRLISMLYYSSSTLVQYFTGRMEEGLKDIENAISIAQELGITTGMGTYLRRKITCLQLLGRRDEAFELAKEMLRLAEENSDSLQQGCLYSHMGKNFYLDGDLECALQYRLKGLMFLQRVVDPHFLADNLAWIGVLYLKLGDSETAENYLNEAWNVICDSDDMITTTAVCICMCTLLFSQERFAEASDYLAHTQKMFIQDCLPYFILFESIRGTALVKTGKKEAGAKLLARYRAGLDKLPNTLKEIIISDEEWIKGSMKKNCTPGIMRVLKRDTITSEVGPSELKKLRENRGQYEFFADFPNQQLFIDGKKVDIFRRRKLSRLLLELVSFPGGELSAKQLYPKIWNRDFDPASDGGTFRSSVTRLRKLLDTGDSFRFILSTSESNCYSFNSSVNYCIITT